MKRTTLISLCAALLISTVSGCDGNTGESPDSSTAAEKSEPSDTSPEENSDSTPAYSTTSASPDSSAASSPVDKAVLTSVASDMFSKRDSRTDYDETTAVKITLNGSSAECSSEGVEINGSTVTITKEATYIISGTLDNGMIIVNAPENAKLQIVLDNTSINSATSAPLYIKEADKVFITLKGKNTLSNGGSFAAIDENNIDAAVFSKQDLTFNGDGKLTVTSPAGHGIVGKDDLVFSGGVYSVSSSSHAIDANDSVRIKSADITAVSGKDSIHAENNDDSEKGFVYIESGSFNLTAEGDGISAGAYLHISDGSFDITAGGGYQNAEAHSSENWGNFGGGFGGGFHGVRPDKPDGGMTPPSDMPDGGGFTPPTDMPSDPRQDNTDVQQMSLDLTSDSSSASDTSNDSTSMKGIKADGNILIEGGKFSINSADDALHSNTSLTICGGEFDIAAGDDAIHADDTLTVSGGTIGITDSYEGLEALHVNVSGGYITMVASDDGLNAAGGNDSSGFTGGRDGMFGNGGFSNFGGNNDNIGMGGFGGFGGFGGNSDGSVVISGGNLNITASGDGIDANGTLEITGGYTVVTGPTQGDTATLDYDKTATISGGTFIGTGAAGMAQSISGSGQGVIAVKAGRQAENTAITISDSSGKTLLSHIPKLSYQIVIFSSPDIVSGDSYTLTIGSASETVTAE